MSHRHHPPPVRDADPALLGLATLDETQLAALHRHHLVTTHPRAADPRRRESRPPTRPSRVSPASCRVPHTPMLTRVSLPTAAQPPASTSPITVGQRRRRNARRRQPRMGLARVAQVCAPPESLLVMMPMPAAASRASLLTTTPHNVYTIHPPNTIKGVHRHVCTCTMSFRISIHHLMTSPTCGHE